MALEQFFLMTWITNLPSLLTLHLSGFDLVHLNALFDCNVKTHLQCWLCLILITQFNSIIYVSMFLYFVLSGFVFSVFELVRSMYLHACNSIELFLYFVLSGFVFFVFELVRSLFVHVSNSIELTNMNYTLVLYNSYSISFLGFGL